MREIEEHDHLGAICEQRVPWLTPVVRNMEAGSAEQGLGNRDDGFDLVS
jgi:hypothetical protein